MDVWVARFGVPLHVITDRGTQFEAAVFSQLAAILGFHRLRTTAYHPQTNGMVERLHRTLKTAIIARKKQWLQALPVVLLSIRATVNDSGFAPFTAVTGGLMLHPRVVVNPQPADRDTSDAVRALAERMSEVDFVTLSAGSDHSVSRPYLPQDLQTCTHVWLRVDRVRRPLEAPYVGPLRVLERTGRWFRLELPSGRTDTVSVARLKPAYHPSPAEQISAPGPMPTPPSVPPSRGARQAADSQRLATPSPPVAPLSRDCSVREPPSDSVSDSRAESSDRARDSAYPVPVRTRAGRRVRFRVPPQLLF